MTFPFPRIYQNNPKSNYLHIDYIDKYGRSVRSMISKPVHTCEESPAMQDYYNGIDTWLKSI